MSIANTESYPSDGPDWMDENALQFEFGNSQANLEESYTGQVADVRDQFFGTLAAHLAIHQGRGWAIFDDEQEGDVASIGDKEVLLVSGKLQGEYGIGDYQVPLARIITNEPLRVDDKVFFITEDVMITPSGRTKYYLSAILNGASEQEDEGTTMQASLSPLFMATDGVLRGSSNLALSTPVYGVPTGKNPYEKIYPYGNTQSLSDDMYALERMQALLGSVADLKPVSQHTF